MYRNSLLALAFAAAVLSAGTALAADAPAEDQYAAAAALYSAADWAGAAQAFSRFAAENPGDKRAAAAHFFCGEALVQERQYVAALIEFKALLEQDPAHKQARIARFRIGECLLLSDRPTEAAEALASFRSTYLTDELNGFALAYLGNIALNSSLPQHAREYYEQALRDFPTSPLSGQCRLGLARCLQAAGELKEAIEQYEQVASDLQSRLADDARLAIGLALHEEQRYAEAEESFAAFRTTFADSELAAQAIYWLGLSQIAGKRFPAAIATLTAAAEQFAASREAPAIHAACGDAFRYAGNAAQAEVHYQRVLADWPASEWADDALAGRLALASAAGDKACAEAVAAELIQKFPASPLAAQAQMTRALGLLGNSQYQEAEQALGQLATSLPAAQLPRIHYYLAVAQAGQQKFAESLATLDQIDATQNTGTLGSAIREARLTALLGLKRYSDAVPLLRMQLAAVAESQDRAIATRSQLVSALAASGELNQAAEETSLLPASAFNAEEVAVTALQLAESAYRAENFSLAEQLFQKLTASSVPAAQRSQALSGLAWTQFRTAGKAASAATFQRLLTDYPTSPLAAEAALVRGRALEESQQSAAALEAYRAVIEKYAQSKHLAPALWGAARMHLRLSQPQQAAPLLIRLLDEHPAFEERDAALYELSCVQTDLKEHDQSDKTLARLLAECPESKLIPDATIRLAQRAARQGKSSEAATLLDGLLAADGTSPVRENALYLRGQVAAAGNNWSDVARFMQQHCESFPNSSVNLSARYWQAEAAFRQGNFEDALEQLSALENSTKNRNEPWLGIIPLRRAQCLAQQNRWSEALKSAQGVASRYPQFKQLHEADYLIGRALGNQGRFDDARVAYLRVLDAPSAKDTEIAAMAQWMIGESHFHQQHYLPAVEAYERCLAEHNKFPRWQATSLLQAGKCRLLLGETERARQDFTTLLAQFADQPVAGEAQDRLNTLETPAATAARPSPEKTR